MASLGDSGLCLGSQDCGETGIRWDRTAFVWTVQKCRKKQIKPEGRKEAALSPREGDGKLQLGERGWDSEESPENRNDFTNCIHKEWELCLILVSAEQWPSTFFCLWTKEVLPGEVQKTDVIIVFQLVKNWLQKGRNVLLAIFCGGQA